MGRGKKFLPPPFSVNIKRFRPGAAERKRGACLGAVEAKMVPMPWRERKGREITPPIRSLFSESFGDPYSGVLPCLGPI